MRRVLIDRTDYRTYYFMTPKKDNQASQGGASLHLGRSLTSKDPQEPSLLRKTHRHSLWRNPIWNFLPRRADS